MVPVLGFPTGRQSSRVCRTGLQAVDWTKVQLSLPVMDSPDNDEVTRLQARSLAPGGEPIEG